MDTLAEPRASEVEPLPPIGCTEPSRAENSGPPERSSRAFWLNAAALAVVLLGVLALMHPRALVVPDEGVYLAQAEALTEGSWSVGRDATDVDTDGALSRLLPEATLGDREVPYARHATYPLLLAPAFRLGDYVGTLVLSVLGLWGAALSGALIARRLDPKLAIPTLWLIGAGSPLLFYGFVTMAHSLAAAAAGFAFLGLTRWLDDHRWSGLAFGVPALLATVGLRSEGTIYALAVAAAVGLLAFVEPGDRDRSDEPTGGHANGHVDPSRIAAAIRRVDVRAVVTSAVIGVSVVGTYVLDTRLDDMITGNDGYGVNPASIATRASADPVSGSWASLLRPFANSWDSSALWVTLAAVLLVAASVVLRRAPRRSRLALVLLMAAGASALAMLVDPPWLVTGMLVTFPLLPAGLIWLRRSDISSSASSRVLYRIILVSVIATGGLIATIYANGGAAEWGGRFFQILIPVLTPAAVLGLHRAATTLPVAERRAATACVVLVTAALSFGALRAQAEIRGDATDTVDGTIAHISSSFPGDSTLVVVAHLDPNGNSRLFWRSDDSIEVLTTLALEALPPALERAAEAGRDHLVVVTDATRSEFEAEVSGDLDEIGWEVLDVSTTPARDSTLVVIGESATT
jgi:hypothetical protein